LTCAGAGVGTTISRGRSFKVEKRRGSSAMGGGEGGAGMRMGLDSADAVDCGDEESELEHENDPGATSVIGMMVNSSVDRGTAGSDRGEVRPRPSPTPIV
jgi:hypothetical protein